MNLGSRYNQHSFAQTPAVYTSRSSFDRSFAAKDTMNFDYLYPFFVEEILPGDDINLNVQHFMRLATQTVPLMDNLYVDFFFFFVPNRLVWNNWEKLCGAQEDPGDSISYITPIITVNTGSGFVVDTIYDKFGIPTGVDDISINALPLRGYNLIWNEWFRDQNLQNSVTVNKGDGPDALGDVVLLKRANKHDYFMSMLPSPQRGSTSVPLPIGTSAPVLGIGKGNTAFGGSQNVYESGSTTIQNFPFSRKLDNASGVNYEFWIEGTAATGYPNIYADLSAATAATINQFRQAIMVQSLLELDARGGTRYVEIIRAHFNVVSPDFRLQRPEFLGGGSSRINQHPVAQTSESGTTPQGNLAAFSTASSGGSNIGFTKSFDEHGFVIGLVQARADVTYQQGLARMWSRSTRYDYFWPKFQELGEQAVYLQELYITNNAATNITVLGYQERYADYRYRPSEIRGQFRSTFAQSLDVWHMGIEYGSQPALNSTLIQSNTPIDRVLDVAVGYPALLCDYWFNMKHARCMTVQGVPASLGRF